ncbi:hypothetical protein D1007_25475 [Hordeum vulgare]|nr:hypothetical protein D1007_25475 [Hordeum vulgare]
MGLSPPKDSQNISLEDEINSYLDAQAYNVLFDALSYVVIFQLMPFRDTHELWTKLQDKYALENEQPTKESLEETFPIELSRLKESHDRALEVANDFRTKNDKLEVPHAKLVEDYEHLENGSRAIKSSLIELTESHAELEASYAKELAKLPSPLIVNNDACATNSTSCEASILKENIELRDQLELLSSNYGKLEESHVMLTSSHDDLLVSHNVLKLAHEAITAKLHLVMNYFPCLVALTMSTLNNVLCGQKSPNDKDGLGFNSKKKNKSKSFKKKGREQVKNSAKIICFKCKIEGHHVRSCPLKKKPQSHKQQGKRPQVQSPITRCVQPPD